jgi:hypothetical protein
VTLSSVDNVLPDEGIAPQILTSDLHAKCKGTSSILEDINHPIAK